TGILHRDSAPGFCTGMRRSALAAGATFCFPRGLWWAGLVCVTTPSRPAVCRFTAPLPPLRGRDLVLPAGLGIDRLTVPNSFGRKRYFPRNSPTLDLRFTRPG